MDAEAMRLDGNAMAGELRQVFVREMTSARIACTSCGKVEPVGAEHVYMQGPGIVMRCCHCDGALLVVTPAGGRYVLGFRGAGWLEFAETE
jgi:Family of unknown function (DUF6510)